MSLSKAVEVVTGINEFSNLFQLVKSAISYLRSQWNGTQEQQIQEHEVLQLQSDLRDLSETLPAMYNLIDRAEWKSHEKCVAELLPKLKDAVYDAEDLLDEFSSYELKVSIEGNATQLSPFIEFFHSVTQGSFNKVNDIQQRLNNLSSHLERIGLHEASPRFDKCVRPVTTSFRTEPKIFGRENEIEEIVRLLDVPNYSSRSSSKRKRTSNAANNEPRTTFVPVLPIVGMGGVGKTTLAQEITTLQRVKSHFDKIIWICVSDDFNVERFTKVLIKSLSGNEATTDNFDDLQQDLVALVGEKRFLLILDDIWPDALEEDGLCWRKFRAPLENVLQGSMMLVTTRFAEVADTVGTMESFALKGLKPEVFWDFLKLCVFGSEGSHIDPRLELIGRSILPKLKGSPLAAKTIGRLLRKNLNTEHWNHILNSELWQIRQNGTDILPALRLSYMYLPFHLKRCFSFCAVYPKDYSFQKASLAEIWMAEGFIEPQGNIPLQHIGDQYFEDLVSLSFFQKLRGTYVIHDLMHDMAQLVSKDECFIINNTSDYGRVPQNVRHLSILKSSDVNLSNLSSLCHHTKLRTLLCNKYLRGKTSVIDRWFSELLHLRVVSCAYMKEPPESIGNLKNLRYLEISTACRMSSRTIPSSFCCLYNLQILYARNCLFENLPVNGLSKMINLQKFEAHVPLQIQAKEVNAVDWGKGIYSIRNTNQITRDVTICNIGAISKDHAVEMNLRTKDYLNSLTLIWSPPTSVEHNEMEVIEALHLPNNLKFMHLKDYPGEYLPSWFQSFNCLEKLKVSDCPNIKSQKLFAPSLKTLDLVNSGNLGHSTECSSLRHFYLSGSGLTSIQLGTWSLPALQKLEIIGCQPLTFIGGIFSSLTELIIEECNNLSSLEQFVQPVCLPAIKKIVVKKCQKLVSLPTARFGDMHCLEDLEVSDCPSIISRDLLFAASLKKLELIKSGSLGCNIECSSLTYLHLSYSNLSSVPLEMRSHPALEELRIIECDSLEFIGKADRSHHSSSNVGTLLSLTNLIIKSCRNLRNIDVLQSHDLYLPALRRICVSGCAALQFLPGERFRCFLSLRDLEIVDCPRLNWQSGMVLPSSLQSLSLRCCGDISSWFPGCLENLTSLQTLEMVGCERIVSIPGHMWRNNLPSLKILEIMSCPDLVSIGGQDAIAHMMKVSINSCAELLEIDQPMKEYRFWLS